VPKKILIADDSPTVRNVAESLLRKHGYEILLADDGAKALSLAQHEKPDMVFLDSSLPGLSGEEVCKKLRQNESLKGIMVIMLLSKDDPKTEKELRLIGADAFMVKPFSPGEILTQVKNLLEKKEPSSSNGKSEITQSPAGYPIEKEKSEEGLDIIEYSDLMQDFERSIPPSEKAGVHGFEWFLSELQKEALEDVETDSRPQEKPILSAKTIQSKSTGVGSTTKPIVPGEEKSPFLKHSAGEKKSSNLSALDKSELDFMFSDLKEKISEKIAQEVTKKMTPEFLEKIIREEMSKLSQKSLSPSEK
jgi:DNA-binding response OmpR family regulator